MVTVRPRVVTMLSPAVGAYTSLYLLTTPVAREYTHFTCLNSTKVQIMTQESASTRGYLNPTLNPKPSTIYPMLSPSLMNSSDTLMAEDKSPPALVSTSLD